MNRSAPRAGRTNTRRRVLPLTTTPAPSLEAIRSVPRRSPSKLMLLACLALVALLTQVFPPPAVAVPTPNEQLQLVPAYFRPTGAGASDPWVKMCDRAKVTSLVIMNPNSGPGSSYDPLYGAAVQYCQKTRGQRVIGYLTSDYGARTLSQVYAEIDAYYSLYPDIKGIFVDEMLNCEVCVFQNGMSVPVYYSRIYSHVKQKSGSRGVVVGNPGAAASSNWQVDSTPVADIVVVFEGSASTYTGWSPPAWVMASNSRKFSQMVYAVSTANRTSVCNKTRTTNAGFIYVTDDVLPNPWDRLPGYWTQLAPACT